MRTPHLGAAVLATCAALLAAASVAVGFTPALGASFSGNSRHNRYSVRVDTECLTAGCHASAIAQISLQALGRHVHAPCTTSSSFQLGNAPIKHGRFTATGEFLGTPRGELKFTATGTFTASHRVRGTFTGPKSCGGADSYDIAVTS